MKRLAVTFLALVAMATTSAMAQTSDRPGRYSMAPAAGGGFARLDTETGQISICQPRGGEWACSAMEDDGRKLRADNDRLAIENRRLKEELRRYEDAAVGSPGRLGKDPRAERHGGQLTLPSEQDLDNAFSYVERMLKKFREKLKDLEDDRGGAPL